MMARFTAGVVFDRDIPANLRSVYQNYPQLNSSGAIVPTGSSALANQTSVGLAIVPYNNAGGSLVLAGAAGNAIVHSVSTIPDGSILASPDQMLSGSQDYYLTQGNPLTNNLARQAGIPDYIDLSKPNNVAGLSYENLMQHYQLRGFEVTIKAARSSSSGKAKIFELPNHPDIKQIKYHPRGKTHGETPYYKFTLRNKQEIRIVPEPDKFYPGTISSYQKYFNAQGQEMTYDYTRSK